MKLTPEEIVTYNFKKTEFFQTNDDMAIGLGVDSFELYKAVNGLEVASEVVQAVREWIA